MIPQLQVALGPNQTTIQGCDAEQVNEVCNILKAESTNPIHVRNPQPVDTMQYNQKEYKEVVSKGLAEIRAGKYTKVILSRAVDINRLVDMPATLLHGRRANTPARSYLMKHGGFQALGFSPELVMAVDNGMVVTE
jgi:salicylate synthetase